FISPSNVALVCSYVNRLMFEGLPILNDGLFIHFHDIFYPFEYPKSWIYEGRAWNEAYVLLAFLQFNSRFRIVYFLDYLERFYRHKFELDMPLCLNNTGSSFWLEKMSSGSG